jgi:hypothetical protein
MIFRRVLFYWQLTAVVLLPGWVLVGQSLWGNGLGWDFLLYLVLTTFLAVYLLAMFILTRVRKHVRVQRAVSWPDAAVMTVWHLAIIVFGVTSWTPLLALIIVGGIAAFWVAIWQLFTETRSRVKEAFTIPDFPRDATPVSAGHYEAGHYEAVRVDPAAPMADQIIIIESTIVEEDRR